MLLMFAAAKREAAEACWWLNMAAAAACEASRAEAVEGEGWPPLAGWPAAPAAEAAVRSELRIWRERVISAALLFIGLMFCKRAQIVGYFRL